MRSPSTMLTIRLLAAFALSALSLSVQAAGGEPATTGSAGPDEPNVVFILVDDLGINDLSLNPLRGPETPPPPVSTPHIDRIGHEGAVFSSAYASHAICAPSRAGIMTGRYQQRFGFQFNPERARAAYARRIAAYNNFGLAGTYHPEREALVPDRDQLGISTDEVPVARLLKDAGYRTGLFGKWHLGSHPSFRPENRGFHTVVGFYGAGSLYAPVDDPDIVNAPLPIDEDLWSVFPYVALRNGEPLDTTQYQTDLWADEAISFLRAGDAPYFAYVAFNAPHNPLQVPRSIYEELDHVADHEARVYYGMIVALDRAVGRILEAIETSGEADNTLVVFASDNGGAEYTHIWTHNLPLRGYKATFWEGGFRSPLFIRWPSRIQAGTRIDSRTSLLDLYPTLAAAAGVAPPQDRIIDGRSLLPTLARPGAGSGHQRLYWRAGDYYAVLDDDYKYITHARPEPGRHWLYRVVEGEPMETENVAEEMPAVVERYRGLLRDHFEPMEKARWPSTFEFPVLADPPAGEGDVQGEETDWVLFPG